MNAEVIAIGDEILSGHTRDTNFAVIAARLGDVGIQIAQHTVVPDEREALGRELTQALERASIVILTGGLGATPDDLTRRVMASALGRKLIFREGLLGQLREKYASRGVTMSPAHEAMALVPAGAQPLENRLGMAPGLLLRTERSVLFALPGVPAEMECMLTELVIPLLQREGITSHASREVLRTVGVSEMTLAQTIRPLIGKGVQVAYLPGPRRVDLRLWTPPGEANNRVLGETVEAVASRLGPIVYGRGDSTLEETVVELARRRRRTIGLGESLTGGRIGAALTQVAGSSQVFHGGVVSYSNRAKVDLLGVAPATLDAYGAVSASTAEEMASGARRRLHADIGLSATGIAGPSGGSPQKPVGLVHFGLSDAQQTRSLATRLGGSREMILEACVTLALNMLRLLLIDRTELLWDDPAASGESRGR